VRNAYVTPRKRKLAKRLRREATTSEKLAWKLLRGRQLLGLKFRRQQVVCGYVVDFYCAEVRVAIEIDGGIHKDPCQAEYDVKRTAQLQEIGVVTIRLGADNVSAATLLRLVKPIVERFR
jgi:very-short-patch-repair endonuclease